MSLKDVAVDVYKLIMDEVYINLLKDLLDLLDRGNNCLKEIEKLELCVSDYVMEELKNLQSEKLSENFIKYSLEKINQALILHEIYNKSINIMNKLIINNINIPQEIKEYWSQVNKVIKEEIEEQELLGNYILDYSKGKELSTFEKEFIDKTFKGISKLKNKEK